ncbi:MAG: VWA-like domain-containing protein [Pseudomonadota bacterium]
MTHSARARAALARLPEVDPAIAALALWCRFRDADGPTATEGETILIGPAFPHLPISEQVGVIAHHVLHVALRHSGRRTTAAERHGGRFRAGQYDLACDALVNEALLQGGHALPRPAVRAADIVALLPPEDRPENVLDEWDSDKLYAAMTAQRVGPGEATEGEIERYAQAQGFEPDLKGSDPDSTEAEVWAGRVEQAMQAGQRAGSGIGAALSALGDLPKARVPWEVKLRRLLAKALAEHPRQTYRRPARSWLARDALALQMGGGQPVFEPATAREGRRPRLVIGLDTSSSIQPATLDMFAAEALSIVRRTGVEAHLLGFDTEVHSRTVFRSADALTAVAPAMRRDGGTDFDAVLAEAQALDPSHIIMLTDLDAPTQQVVAAPVLWAVPAQPIAPPGYGEVLIMDDAA